MLCTHTSQIRFGNHSFKGILDGPIWCVMIHHIRLHNNPIYKVQDYNEKYEWKETDDPEMVVKLLTDVLVHRNYTSWIEKLINL